MKNRDVLGGLNKNVCLMDGSRSCEISGYLYNKTVGYLKKNNYNLFTELTNCDTVLINTCGVIKSKVQSAERLIDQALSHAGVKRIILFGCLPKIVTKYQNIEKVISIGPKEIERFDDYFEHEIPISNVSEHIVDKRYFLPYQLKVDNKDYYVLIGQGCKHNCSYCNIKKAKGNAASRSIKDIVHDIKKGMETGRFEFFLLADDCGSYGCDLKTDLIELIKQILDLDKRIKVKISTLFPGDLVALYPRLKKTVDLKRISYINIPLQSGAGRVLKLMNRDYNVGTIINIVRDIKNLSPSTWLYTHFIIGFPRETRKDFMRSVKASSFFDESMFITYSDNARTSANKIFPKISQEEQDKRVEIVKSLSNNKLLVVDKQDAGSPGEIQKETPRGAQEEAQIVPLVVQISLTDKCQCDCKYCGVKDINRAIKNELSLDKFREIFRDLRTAGVGAVDFSGGEPTLRKELPEIVRLATSQGLKVHLETNGALIDHDYAKTLKNLDVATIWLSLDGYKEEIHDTGVGRRGLFKKAVKALNCLKQFDLNVHTSFVPFNREYFVKGDINTYIKFCLQNGARKVRILFPSYVGNCSKLKKNFCSEKDELKLLTYIDKEWHDYVYVESQMSPLKTILSNQEVLCPAKICFCYIAGNGLVTPCPYLPIVFGDITRESIIEIFYRMQDHPYLKNSGIYCPTRDKKYLKGVLKDIDENSPLKYARCFNKINFGSPCNNNCHGCVLISKNRTRQDIIAEIKKTDARYGSLHLFGGEIFLRKDIFKILDKIPKKIKIVLYTNGRIFTYLSLAKKIKKYNIRAVKIPFFSLDENKFNRFSSAEDGYSQTMMGIRNLCREGMAVSIYIPDSEIMDNLDPLISMGVASISSYKTSASDNDALPDTILCFGKKIERTKLIWMNHTQ